MPSEALDQLQSGISVSTLTSVAEPSLHTCTYARCSWTGMVAAIVVVLSQAAIALRVTKLFVVRLKTVVPDKLSAVATTPITIASAPTTM